jgi:hypothetical protein
LQDLFCSGWQLIFSISLCIEVYIHILDQMLITSITKKKEMWNFLSYYRIWKMEGHSDTQI